MSINLLFQLLVLIFSIMIHEIAHGAIALKLGDDTAQKLGRLTFNPLKHIDPIGSVFLPLILIFLRSPFLIGWAKPVPYDPRFLKNPKSGAALIALAGPVSNLAIAFIFGMLLRLSLFPVGLSILLALIVYINLLLAVFNLVPIPPLDGSKLLFYFIPDRGHQIQRTLEQYGPLLLLLFIIIGFNFLVPIIQILFTLIVGQSL